MLIYRMVFVYTSLLLLGIGQDNKRSLQQLSHTNDFRDSKIMAPQRRVAMSRVPVSAEENWQQYIPLCAALQIRALASLSHTHICYTLLWISLRKIAIRNFALHSR